jgi:uncharacterized protein YecE (DUF72 family)
VKQRLWIGTSGFVYKHWKDGVFYPPGLPQKKWFEYYTSRFTTLEINSTFYRLASREAMSRWARDSPPGFRFVAKGSRYITHMKRLTDPAPALRNFFRPLKPLGPRLTAVLWQFPERALPNVDRLAAFIDAFRKMSSAALVFEFRNAAWFTDAVTAILKKDRAVFCRADRPDFYQQLTIPDTAPFRYYRYHGPMLYAGGYSDERLQHDARQMQTWLHGGRRDLYAFFNNDIGGHAPHDAARLRELLIANR